MYLPGAMPVENWLLLQISVLRCWQFLGGKLGSLVYFRTGFWGKVMNIAPAVPPAPTSPPSCPYWKVAIRAMRTCNLLTILQMNVVSNFLKMHRNFNLPVTYTAGNGWVFENLGGVMTVEQWLFPGANLSEFQCTFSEPLFVHCFS